TAWSRDAVTAMSKRVRTISLDDVPVVFDGRRLKELAHIARLPADADRVVFAKSVFDAVREYAQSARIPTPNDVHRAIKALHRSASRAKYDEAAGLLENLSSEARDWLNKRGKRPGWEETYGAPGVTLPDAASLRDPRHCRADCDLIVLMCTDGGAV